MYLVYKAPLVFLVVNLKNISVLLQLAIIHSVFPLPLTKYMYIVQLACGQLATLILSTPSCSFHYHNASHRHLNQGAKGVIPLQSFKSVFWPHITSASGA